MFDSVLGIVILADLFFLAPLTLLLTIQAMNFFDGQTTSTRFKMNDVKKQAKLIGGLKF